MLVCCACFIHSFIHAFIHALIHSFIHSFIHNQACFYFTHSLSVCLQAAALAAAAQTKPWGQQPSDSAAVDPSEMRSRGAAAVHTTMPWKPPKAMMTPPSTASRAATQAKINEANLTKPW